MLGKIAFLLRLLGKGLQIPPKRVAQIIDEALDFLGRRILLKRFAQAVLRRLNVTLGFGNIAVLDVSRKARYTDLSGIACSSPIDSASSAIATLSAESGSRTSFLRCSTTALASGLVKLRSGRMNS